METKKYFYVTDFKLKAFLVRPCGANGNVSIIFFILLTYQSIFSEALRGQWKQIFQLINKPVCVSHF